MATLLTRSIESGFLDVGQDAPNVAKGVGDGFTAPMLTSAVGETVRYICWVSFKLGMAFVLTGFLLSLLLDQLTVNFFAAWSAALAVLYVANLSDVVRIRDAVSLLVPAGFIWAVLLFASGNPVLVGVTLFTHLLVAFFAALSRTSGSLKDAGLWSILFGTQLALLIHFVFGFVS